MTRRTPLGIFFLTLGTAAFVAALLPAFHKHAEPVATVPLCIGAAIAVLGALLIDFSSTKDSLAAIWIYVGDVLPGGRRKTDPQSDGTPKPPTFP